MAKIQKYIVVVRSTSPGMSSMGGRSCQRLVEILSENYQKVEVVTVNNPQDLQALVELQPDLAFLGAKRIPVSQGSKEYIWLAQYLEENGINYSGSPASAIKLDFSKPAGKRVVRQAGLLTTQDFMAHEGQFNYASELPFGFPLFIKPPAGGGGKGIDADSVVRDFATFQRKVAAIGQRFKADALVEQYLPGREFSVAILESPLSKQPITMPIEMIASTNQNGDCLLGQQVKAEDTERIVAVPAGRLRQAVEQLALDVFEVLGGRDYGRIDIRLDQQGRPHFLEANLIPGLAQHDFTSYFISACQLDRQLDHPTIILSLIEQCLNRDESALELAQAPNLVAVEAAL